MTDGSKNMNLIECDECGHNFLAESVSIEECSVEISGKIFLLRYFACSKCNKIYKIILVEEQKYHELVNDMLTARNRVLAWQGKKNKQVLKNLQNIFQKKEDNLRRYIKAMDAKYKGTFTFKSSENNQKEIVYLPRV